MVPSAFLCTQTPGWNMGRYETFCQLTLSSTAVPLVQTRKSTLPGCAPSSQTYWLPLNHAVSCTLRLWRRFENILERKPPCWMWGSPMEWPFSSSLRRSGLRVCCQARVGFFLSSSCFDVGHSQHHRSTKTQSFRGLILCFKCWVPQSALES